MYNTHFYYQYIYRDHLKETARMSTDSLTGFV